MGSTRCLVLGTRNRKKRYELTNVLAVHRIEVRTLDDFPQSLEVDETGTTFRRTHGSRQPPKLAPSASGSWRKIAG